MYHWGKATTDCESEGSFDTRDEALDAAHNASIYRDDVLAVWSDDDQANPDFLCWGGTVYSA